MKQKEIALWGLFGLAFLIALYLAFRGHSTAPTGANGVHDPYAEAVARVDPVQYHTQRAYAFEGNHDYPAAAEEYRALIGMNPRDKDLHSHLGEVYYKLGMKDKAVDEIREVVRLKPDDWAHREILGDIHAEAGRADKAIDEYRQALQANPENALCNVKLGRLYYARGDCTSAARAFSRSLEIFQDMVEAHLGLGLCAVAGMDNNGAEREVKELERLKRQDLVSQLKDAIAARQKPPAPEQ